MSQALPEIVDAWRMVDARRTFQGSVRLATMSRLASALAVPGDNAEYDLEFGKDQLGVRFLQVRVDAVLPLTCQRTLETFALPVRIDTRLGLITDEADEAGLPEGYEPLLVTDGSLRLADVIEDELILAIPVIPVKPGTEYVPRVWGDAPAETDATPPSNPFAALKELKKAR